MAKDDEELFEHAMETLGTKQGGRAAPRPSKPRPAGVTVTEDLDFDALMREGRGPATEIATKKVRTRDEAEDAAPIVPAATAPPPPSTRSRYLATEAESREFIAAMRELQSVPGKDPATPRGARPPADDLGRLLKRGEVEPEAVLDLHGKTQKEARPRLVDFLREARTEGWQVVMIIVGKGLRSDRGEAVLRPLVERWLRDDHRDIVREVHEAPSHLGGSGAWVAALRRG